METCTGNKPCCGHCIILDYSQPNDVNSIFCAESEYRIERTRRISKVLNALVKKSFSIRSRITGWYNYTTSDSYHIIDANLYNEERGGNGVCIITLAMRG